LGAVGGVDARARRAIVVVIAERVKARLVRVTGICTYDRNTKEKALLYLKGELSYLYIAPSI